MRLSHSGGRERPQFQSWVSSPRTSKQAMLPPISLGQISPSSDLVSAHTSNDPWPGDSWAILCRAPEFAVHQAPCSLVFPLADLDVLGLPLLCQLKNVLGSARFPVSAPWTGNCPGSELKHAWGSPRWLPRLSGLTVLRTLIANVLRAVV